MQPNWGEYTVHVGALLCHPSWARIARYGPLQRGEAPTCKRGKLGRRTTNALARRAQWTDAAWPRLQLRALRPGPSWAPRGPPPPQEPAPAKSDKPASWFPKPAVPRSKHLGQREASTQESSS
eukprot:15478598-Alexandrium_andersonii.AAC.1